MFITYRRTGGVFTLLALAVVALAATVFAVVLAAAVVAIVIVVAAAAAAVLLVRAMLPASWRRRRYASGHTVAHETIEATLVHPPDSSDNRLLLRVDSDKG